MKTTLSLNSIFVHSEEKRKSFYAKFGSGLNVIYGANTSGKSTIIQLILYTFGINDHKVKLAGILSENIFVRVDFSIKVGSAAKKFTFIRRDETLFVKDNIREKVTVYNGISGNNSVEHGKLKKFISDLLGFSLQLESKSSVTSGPIESIFLPYYVSQEVGWVYLRKSFSHLEFYRNFKDDFLDYYLGIANREDKNEKRKLESNLAEKQHRLNFYTDFRNNGAELRKARAIDQSFRGKGQEFVEKVNLTRTALLKQEKEYVTQSNSLTHNAQRLSVISKVMRNIDKQHPGEDPCPICNQILPTNPQLVYEHFHRKNDTVRVKAEIQDTNKKIQSKINSLHEKIRELRGEVADSFHEYLSYSQKNVTFEDWIHAQATVQLTQSITSAIGDLYTEIEALKKRLKKFKDDKEIQEDRDKRNKQFRRIYTAQNKTLGVPRLSESRFNDVYEINSFPFQGVELHLAVLSYHFAFNKLVYDTADVHRLPLMLDSIFKEDLEADSKEKILRFITQNRPNDTQTIISIADNKKKEPKIDYYAKKFFTDDTNLICIGDSVRKKSVLAPHDTQYDDILENTFEIMETI